MAHQYLFPRTISSAEFNKIQKYCAFQERSQQEVRDKLYSYGLHRNEVEQIIAQLITENYLNEERFAIAYAGGKFRINQWGRIKIRAALKQKKISDYCIRKALDGIPEDDYEEVLTKIISDKSRTVSEKNLFKKNQKVAQYAISCGYEPELVWQKLKS